MPNPIDPTGRLTAFGTQLIEIHDWLREELTRLREEVEPGGRTLRANCLAFCSALEQHHTQEDDTAFVVLVEHFPELGPVIDELRRDHHLVAGILLEIEALVGGHPPDLDAGGRQRVRAELDGLTALLESHFTYEERKLVAALNALHGDQV
jgi:hemerythrin-like domain-containing protein